MFKKKWSLTFIGTVFEKNQMSDTNKMYVYIIFLRSMCDQPVFVLTAEQLKQLKPISQEICIVILSVCLSSIHYFFVNYFDFEPVLDEVLCCPKGLRLAGVASGSTGVVGVAMHFFSLSNWKIASKCLSDPLPAV